MDVDNRDRPKVVGAMVHRQCHCCIAQSHDLALRGDQWMIRFRLKRTTLTILFLRSRAKVEVME